MTPRLLPRQRADQAGGNPAPSALSWLGAVALLAALTAVVFTAQFQSLARDQQLGHQVAWIAVASAVLFAACNEVTRLRVGPAAGWLLLLANSATVWVVVDHLFNDILATLTAASVPVVAAAAYSLLRRSRP